MLSREPDIFDYAIINSALVRPIIIKKMIHPFIRVNFPMIIQQLFSKIQAKTMSFSDEYFDSYFKENKRMKSETFVRILEENMSFTIPNAFSKAKGKM